MVTPAAEREAVAHLRSAFEMSERRACKVIDCCRMTVRYATTRTDDGVLRERMKAMAHERRAGSAIAAFMSCCGGRAMWSITSGCSASTGRRS